VIRKWERKLILSAEYGVKALYAGLIQAATRAAYGTQDDRMQMVVTGWTDALARAHGKIATLERLDGAHTLVAAPRYDEFRDVVLGLARSGAPLEIQEIAGNDEIFLTGIAPAAWRYRGTSGTVVYGMALPTDVSRQRFALRVPVRGLLAAVRALETERGVSVDHIYDY
jgi:hypothetical protein